MVQLGGGGLNLGGLFSMLLILRLGFWRFVLVHISGSSGFLIGRILLYFLLQQYIEGILVESGSGGTIPRIPIVVRS
jgi:hypothetical protein